MLVATMVVGALWALSPAARAKHSPSSPTFPGMTFPDFATLADAAVVAQTGGLTVMTSEVPGEDILLVLDSRNEELFVYRADSKVGVQLLQRYPVPQLFVDARARTRGGGP
jgi:hypothetical protein